MTVRGWRWSCSWVASSYLTCPSRASPTPQSFDQSLGGDAREFAGPRGVERGEDIVGGFEHPADGVYVVADRDHAVGTGLLAGSAAGTFVLGDGGSVVADGDSADAA